MNEQYTEIEGYKHLLEVAENILYSSDIDEEIMQKYEELKSSIHRKIATSNTITSNNNKNNNKNTPYNSNNYNNINDNPTTTFYLSLLSGYRLVIQNAVKIIQSFQQQLEGQMQRQNFNQTVTQSNQQFTNKMQQLQTLLEYSNNSSQNSTTSSTKTKLLHRQELNTLSYEHEQLESKYENLGLLIEVHKKMHEIILQATKTEQKKVANQDKYKQRINQLEQQLALCGDAKMFIEQHKITQANYAQFVTASRALKKVLFATNNQFK